MAIPGTSEQSVPAAGTYEIDPVASTVRFDTRAMCGLLPVRGTFTISRGRITVAESPEESSVEVAMDAASFESGNQQRDDHVRSSDYLDVARHPEIAFRSQRLERSAQDASLQGELTACGVTQPVSVTVTSVTREDRRITANGTATLDRYAFGVTKAKGMTGRHLKITLEVVADR
ncbi:YceI family protein [Streptomyces sp. NPDC096191]|uniref:YceI family protein n=1 Tax=Streptomyces sp. NPDC096191 TaxID=3155426 RepID=UPI00331A9923